MRELARRAGIAVSYLSNLEAGRLSPSLAMLRKVLVALGTDLEPFFANSPAIPKGRVFRLPQMRRVTDGARSYTFILPPRRDVKLIMFDEVLFAGEDPQFESLTGDLAGYILTGELILEVQGESREALKAGDAFYVPAGKPLRGWCGGNADSVRLVTVQAQGAACPRKARHRGNQDDHGKTDRRLTETRMKTAPETRARKEAGNDGAGEGS